MQGKALIYCRVSDTKQKTEGSGLQSQQHRCEIFAKKENLIVEKVFHDDVSGGGNYNKRPAMTQILEYLKENRHTHYFVIFDDIKRMSRDIYFYWGLIRELDQYGASPLSPNFIFADTPEGRFQQSITVAAGEYERESIARQTRQKTQARLEAGFYAFISPVGFKYVKSKAGGKVLIKDEPAASSIQEMMEGYASGRFQTKEEARYFLEADIRFPKTASGKIANGRIDIILNNPLYAGYIEYKPWGVSLRKAQHEGMVSYETFCKIKERLKGRAYAAARVDLNRDFVLRGAVACECGNALTACWSKSQNGKHHPYYVCQNRKCVYKGKSIRRDVLEGQFETLLKQLTPSKALLKAAEQMFIKLWKNRGALALQHKETIKKKVQKCDAEIAKYLDRIVDSHNATVVNALEKRIDSVEKDKLILAEKMEDSGHSAKPYQHMYRTAMEYLYKPYKLWSEGGYIGKRIVLKLTFTEHLIWDRNGMYRTPELSLPFKVLGGFLGVENQMVHHFIFQV